MIDNKTAQPIISSMHHDVSFDDDHTIRSNQFGDIYFSTEDGVAETNHVFLKNNNLPDAWQNSDHFTIAETGFGTGLNILCVWQLFEEMAEPHQRLDLISTEKFPLKKEEIARALEPFKKQFSGRVEKLLSQYPILIPGFHRIWLSDRVTLTLIFDDAANGFTKVDTPIDAWFLDGFAPAKNPDMWSSELFQEMARLSHNQTTFATFTAAGLVKRGLEAVGFQIDKTSGFGRKRDMLIGQFKNGQKTPIALPKKVAIIGAGLAGSATAYCLKRRGVDVTVFEEREHVGHGASSNQIALINPKLFADKNAIQTQLSSSGYSLLLRTLDNIDNIDFKKTGSIYLGHTEQRLNRYYNFTTRLGWSQDHIQTVNSGDIKNMTAHNSAYDGIFYPDAGSVNPQKLVEHYLKDVTVITGSNVDPDDLDDYDTIIIANGKKATDIDILSDIPMDLIRGQVTYIKQPENIPTLPHNISFGGYVSATQDGLLAVGATFDHDHDQPILIDDDNNKNLSLLKTALPDFNIDLEIVDQWAGVRCSAKDYLPVIGKLPKHKNIYTHIALGSSGTVNSLIGAEIIASELTGAPLPVSKDVKKALLAQRFLDRKLKRSH